MCDVTQGWHDCVMNNETYRTFGPQHDAVVALIERAKVLTADEFVRLRDMCLEANPLTRNIEQAATFAARLDTFVAAGKAAFVAAEQRWSAIGDGVDDEPSWDSACYAVEDAAHALVARDLIGQHNVTVEDYEAATAVWRTVIGPVHPDDAFGT